MFYIDPMALPDTTLALTPLDVRRFSFFVSSITTQQFNNYSTVQ